MNYEYTEEELSEFPNSVLEKIRVKYGLSKQDRDELINNILTHQDFLEEREKRTPSIKDISYFDNLPRDALILVLLELPYAEIAKRCKLSKKVNSLCNDERFWRQYAENRNLQKDRESDTWKQTAIINYLGRYYPNKDGHILSEIQWTIETAPYDLYRFIDALDDEELDDNTGIIHLDNKDYQKIVFRDPVKIVLPFFPGESEDDSPDIVLTLIPDTPVGSTLEHTLDQVYRKMYGLTKNEDLVNAKEILGEDFQTGHPYFEGFSKRRRTDGAYEISLGS